MQPTNGRIWGTSVVVVGTSVVVVVCGFVTWIEVNFSEIATNKSFFFRMIGINLNGFSDLFTGGVGCGGRSVDVVGDLARRESRNSERANSETV